MRLSERFPIWESKIRKAQGADVAAEISALHPSKVPSDKKPVVANLARRVGLYRYALGLLRQDYLEARENPRANEPLMAEYAATLAEIGATSLAERILSTFDQATYEMTPFYRALLAMKMWRYDLVPEEIAKFKTLCFDPYRLQIADLNLASAFVVLGDFDSATRLLNEVEAQGELALMTRGILDEQKGQVLFFSHKRDQAFAKFSASFDRLKATNNPSAFYAEKWMRIIELLEKPWTEVEERWNDFKGRAEASGFWEVTRELDRFFALHFERRDLLEKLYFGTPYEGYRALLQRDSQWTPPLTYRFSSVKDAQIVFDTRKQKLSVSEKPIRLPLTFSRLLLALSRDLYRPIAVGSLFEAIYPGEYFHPRFASQRVYKVIGRFRAYAKKYKLRLSIEASELGFRLGADSEITFLYSQETRKAAGPQVPSGTVSILQEHFGNREFTAAEVAAATGMPKRSVNRVLSSEIESGTLSASGQGKAIRYRLNLAE